MPGGANQPEARPALARTGDVTRLSAAPATPPRRKAHPRDTSHPHVRSRHPRPPGARHDRQRQPGRRVDAAAGTGHGAAGVHRRARGADDGLACSDAPPPDIITVIGHPPSGCKQASLLAGGPAAGRPRLTRRQPVPPPFLGRPRALLLVAGDTGRDDVAATTAATGPGQHVVPRQPPQALAVRAAERGLAAEQPRSSCARVAALEGEHGRVAVLPTRPADPAAPWLVP